jgi:hypothetical protein
MTIVKKPKFWAALALLLAITAAPLLLAGTTLFTRTGDGGGTVDETVTVVSSPTYTLDDPTVRNIAFDSRVAAITVTIATSWISTPGNFVRVKDWYYSASTNNITYLTEGAELIDLETEAIMGSGGQDGQAWTILTDGSNLGVY